MLLLVMFMIVHVCTCQSVSQSVSANMNYAHFPDGYAGIICMCVRSLNVRETSSEREYEHKSTPSHVLSSISCQLARTMMARRNAMRNNESQVSHSKPPSASK